MKLNPPTFKAVLFWLFAIAVIEMGVLAAASYPESFGGIYILCEVLASFLAFPAFLAVCLIVYLWYRKIHRRWLIFCLKLSLVLMAGVLAYGLTGRHYYYKAGEATDRYVERVARVLDQIKARTGKYPDKLPTQIVGEPEGFLGEDCYRSNGEVFAFEFHDPITLWADYEYCSEDRQWNYFRSRHPARRPSDRFFRKEEEPAAK